MTKEITTSIIIYARPEKVWDVLTHQKAYPNWNPFIRNFTGELKLGQKLKIVIQSGKSAKMTFKPVVLACDINQRLQWKGSLWIKGLFDGTHTFELIENQDGSTTFRQSEIFEGILVGLFNLDNTKDGFNQMNLVLKQICESPS